MLLLLFLAFGKMKPFPDWHHSLQDYWQKTQKFRHRFSEHPWVSLNTPLGRSPQPITGQTEPQTSWWEKLHCSKMGKRIHPPMMFGIAVISLTSIVGYRFYNQPQLAVGSTSPLTIVAPREAQFPDEKTTEEKRRAVRTGIVPRLKRDTALTQELKQNRGQLLDQINQLRKIGAPFPFLNPQLVPLLEQQNLRSRPEPEWQSLRAKLLTLSNLSDLEIQKNPLRLKLPKSLQTQSVKTLKELIPRIDAARDRYRQVLSKLSKVNLDRLSSEIIVTALQLNDPTWQTTQQVIIQVFDRILVQGLPPGISPTLLRETIDLHLRNILPTQSERVATEVLFALLDNQYNLTIDKEETKRQAEQAVLGVEPLMVTTQKGAVIVKAGQTIDQSQFVLLDGLGLSQRGINWEGLGLTAVLVSGSVIIFLLLGQRIHRPLRRRDHLLLCLLSVSAPLMSLLNPRYTDLPALGLLVGSFYGPTFAVSQVILVGGLSGFAVENINWEYLLAGLAGGIVAGLIANKLRSRDDLAVLGLGVGVVQGGVYLLSYFLLSTSVPALWYVILPGAIVYGLLGTAWTIVAIGISPYLERLFDVVTPIRLVELANPNCPLLQRLAKEAPGTFQHTLFVACLAESAARELRCNVELVRTGTLYHDIGKMHDPLGFIENQMGGVNKHDLIHNPYASKTIIKKHVSEGLEMGRKYGLPQVVRDFIPEHQGTLLISYFYYQAKEAAEKAGQPPIAEADFRYDGPIPQSRETAIVMLADSAEAALRSLKEANTDTALVMVHRIFKARWRDNQLKDSGLKYEELPLIVEVFVRVWQQFHHQRIVYPKAALEPATLETTAIAAPEVSQV